MLSWIVRNITVGSFNFLYLQSVFTNHIQLIYIWKQDLASNNQQILIYHKTKPKKFHILQKTLTSKVNVIVLAEFELAYIKAACCILTYDPAGLLK